MASPPRSSSRRGSRSSSSTRSSAAATVNALPYEYLTPLQAAVGVVQKSTDVQCACGHMLQGLLTLSGGRRWTRKRVGIRFADTFQRKTSDKQYYILGSYNISCCFENVSELG